MLRRALWLGLGRRRRRCSSSVWGASEQSLQRLSPSLRREAEELLGRLRELEREGEELAELRKEAGLESEAAEEERRLAAAKAAAEACLSGVVLAQERVPAKSTLLEVMPGVGGEEAKHFAHELLHMYLTFIRGRGWPVEILRHSESGSQGGVLGLRGAELEIAHPEAFEGLRWEGGVHRVQRVPATERGGRIHTSTVAIVVLPVPELPDVVLDRSELRTEVSRASGAGGQHVNTTESKVRIVHEPSGLSVECQETRDQAENRRRCMNKLSALLYESRLAAEAASAASTRQAQMGQRSRSDKIRTYNFPDLRVTDHRFRHSVVGRLQHILSGGPEFAAFVEALEGIRGQQLLRDFLTPDSEA